MKMLLRNLQTRIIIAPATGPAAIRRDWTAKKERSGDNLSPKAPHTKTAVAEPAAAAPERTVAFGASGRYLVTGSPNQIDFERSEGFCPSIGQSHISATNM